MTKAAEAFRTISEVAEALGTPAHVLRFWESKFSQIKPVKRAGGRRYYRPSDVALLAGIKVLLHDRGITIRGVQKILREDGVRQVALLADTGTPADAATGRVMAKPEPRPRRASAAKAAPAPAAPQATAASDEVIATPRPAAAQAAPRPASETPATRLREVETLLFENLPKAPAPAAPTPPPAASAPGSGALLWSDRLRRGQLRATPERAAAAATLAARAQALRDRIAARAHT